MTIKHAEERFFDWMATTRTGSMFKIALGAVLAYVADAASGWNLPPVVLAVILVLVPVAINELNPRDGRYGTRS